MNSPQAMREIIFDGIDLVTGEPSLPPLSPAALGRRVLERTAVRPPGRPRRAIPKNLAFSFTPAWWLIHRPDADPAVLRAVEPLRQQRDGRALPHRGERDWLTWIEALQSAGLEPPGLGDYALILGSPADIPYDFEKMLTPTLVVGRLHLPDSAAYENYVQALLAYERDARATGLRRAAVDFFATDGDRATQASADRLVAPLASLVERLPGGFSARTSRGDAATRARVVERLAGYAAGGAPALLFLASHGAEKLPLALRARYQGSWLPQGVAPFGREPDEGALQAALLTGDDFASGALSPHGAVIFNYACFGAGLHEEHTQMHRVLYDEVRLDEPHPFVSALGQRLLGNERPALAYISALDRAGNAFDFANVIKLFGDAVATVLGVVPGEKVGDGVHHFWVAANHYRHGAENLLNDAQQAGVVPIDLPEEDARRLGFNWWLAELLDSIVLLGDPAAALQPVR